MGKGWEFDTYRQVISEGHALKAFMQAVGITILVAFLFYRSVIALVTGIIIIPFWLKLKRKENQEKYERRMASEFKEYMLLIVAGLQAGYSLERALGQSESELRRLYHTNSVLINYVHVMNQRIAMNMQLEKAFAMFAQETGLEEAISLSEIISFAKRSGGDYGKHIRETALKIEDNISVKEEIQTITTEKRLELKVMCVMPLGILAYISLTSGSFIAPLYGNILGVGLMSVCLVVYGALIMLGRKIIDIKV